MGKFFHQQSIVTVLLQAHENFYPSLVISQKINIVNSVWPLLLKNLR